jgi:hypothetical protein
MHRATQGFDVHYILFTAGISCLAYGIAASMFIQHKELVQTPRGDVFVYFLVRRTRDPNTDTLNTLSLCLPSKNSVYRMLWNDQVDVPCFGYLYGDCGIRI